MTPSVGAQSGNVLRRLREWSFFEPSIEYLQQKVKKRQNIAPMAPPPSCIGQHACAAFEIRKCFHFLVAVSVMLAQVRRGQERMVDSSRAAAGLTVFGIYTFHITEMVSVPCTRHVSTQCH